MKKDTFYCALDMFALVFIAIALILMSFIAGQVVHENTHLSDVIERQHHANQVCYLGVYNLNTFTWFTPFASAWILEEDASNPHHPMDESIPYRNQAIATIICLLLSLICWIRLKVLFEQRSALRCLARKLIIRSNIKGVTQ
jgi:hypothetical protein